MKQEEESYIPLVDFLAYLRKRKKTYSTVGVLSAAITLCLLLITEPKYLVKASFKEATMRSESTSANMLRTLLKAPSGGGGSVDLGAQALSVMKSRQLVQKIVDKLCLQGDIKRASLGKRLCERAVFNYQLARGKQSKPRRYYQFKSIVYSGKECQKIYLIRIAQEQWELRSLQGELLGEYSLNQEGNLEIHLGQEEGCVIELIEDIPLTEPYLMVFYPLEPTIDKACRRLKIKVRRDDVSILDLAYQDPNPQRGAKFLNQLMHEYKYYLIKENSRMAKAQLEYLTTRQEEIADQLDHTLKHHVDYLQKTLGEQGFMGLHQELEMMENKKKRHQQRLLEIELDLNKVARVKTAALFTLQDAFFGEEGQYIQQALLGLKKQKETLDLAAIKRLTSFKEKTREEIARVYPILHLKAPTETMQKLDRSTEKVDIPLPILHSLKKTLGKLSLEKEMKQSNILDKKSIEIPLSREYQNIVFLKQEMKKSLSQVSPQQALKVKRKIHLLDLREKLIKERVEEEKIAPREFEGLDLDTAKALRTQYIHELDDSRLKENELQFAFTRIDQEPLVVTSLSSLAGDVIFQDLMKDIMQLSSQMKNEYYLSEKDQNRLCQQLRRKQDILKTHFKEMLHIIRLKMQCIEDKMSVLEQVTLDLVNQEISIMQEQMETLLEEKTQSLQLEKEVVHDKLKELQHQMKEIPKKWLVENRLQLQSDLHVSMMEGMAQLVESKSVEHHLMQVESKPLDEAYSPLKPKGKPFLIYSFLGGGLGIFILMGIEIAQRVHRGFPVSLKGLQIRGFQELGAFSRATHFNSLQRLKEKELEILRKMVRIFLKENSKTIGIILNDLLDYTQLLAELLALTGEKVLLIYCYPSVEGKKGLLDYLSGAIKEIPIRTHKDVHDMFIGGERLHQVEMLYKHHFRDLLEKLSVHYDKVLLITDQTVQSSQALQLAEFCQKIVITLDEETLYDLYPYHNIENTQALYIAFE
jgi:hypothetical protein